MASLDSSEDDIFEEDLDYPEFIEAETLNIPNFNANLPAVAILGRPNVGKSTLVNRVIGHRSAVVQDTPGVTRDIVKYATEWNGVDFNVLDTGGWSDKGIGIDESIALRSESAINQADLIVLVVDATVGIVDEDVAIAKKLQRIKKPVILVANKVDNDSLAAEVAALWKLGLGEPFPISAIHGKGTADLLDLIVAKLPKNKEARPEKYPRRVALVGKPNVGKSSLLNKLSGKVVSLVHDESGTTVDPVDSLIKLDKETWNFVDTAGLRKKVTGASGIEYYASLRTAAAIDAAEVVVVLIDATETITEQDQRIINMVIEAGKALVIAFNKWDLVGDYRREALKQEIEYELDRVAWAKYLNLSALTGRAVVKLEDYLLAALDSWDKRISTGKLNNWLKNIVAATPPPGRGGKVPKILFVTQASTEPPTFVFFTSGFLEAGYRRFLERKLREEFNFDGSPIKILMRIREKRRK